ncbi:MAG: EAL domain-containing protein [Betaproteobacteria bacterium]|nr:EAL domain-containing protein [Betaproteobacteria bacterium]
MVARRGKEAKVEAKAEASPEAAPIQGGVVAEGEIGKTPFIVGIGASAGGLEALKAVFPGLPADLGLSYVVVQHLSPNYRSMMAQLLGKDTSMSLVEVEHGAAPAPNTVYITPANRNVTLVDGHFELVKPAKEAYPKPSINIFFNSLAESCNEQAIGVVLSGTGSDGAAGIYSIKAAGGFTFAQEPATAKYNSMPQQAIDTGSVDWVLPPEKIGEEIALIVRSRGAVPVQTVDESAQGQLHRLLLKVRKRTKVDFSGYKETTLWRRIARRMAATHMPSLDEYLHHCDDVPDELDRLCKDILISVTSFFRDREAFTALGSLVSKVVKGKQGGEELRIWVSGCATGEEAYSIAILVAEALSGRVDPPMVQIFATDIDMEAMARARRGQFSSSSLDNLPLELVKRYFAQRGERFEVAKPIREMVIFARQDLMQDPPFLRLDLVSCRNVLIYFQAAMQAKILSTFHYGLLPGGHLFLGKSESAAQQEHLFQTVDKDAHIFRRHGVATRIPPLHNDIAQLADSSSHLLNSRNRWAEDGLMRVAARVFLPPCILVAADFSIKHVHGDAGQYLAVPDGRPSLDLGSLIRREFRTELQALLRRVAQDGKMIQGRPRHLAGMDKHKAVQLAVHPVNDTPHERDFLVSFHILERAEPVAEVEPELVSVASKELEDELLATREHLQTLIEELETSNEEMQALNEELQSANEELQSTNEELEASNEELQSTNEELSTVNEELQVKSSALEEAWTDLDNIQRGIDYPLLVLDSRTHLTRFNPAAGRLFGLTAANLGQSWQTIAMPGELTRFDPLLHDSMRERRSLSTLLADGDHHYALHVTPYLKDGEHVRGTIVSLMDETDLFRAERLAREREQQMQAVMTNASVLFAVKDTSGRYLFANPEFSLITGVTAESALGKTDHQLFPAPLANALRDADLEVMRLRGPLAGEEDIDFSGQHRSLLINRFPLFNEENVITAVCMQAVDITARKHAEEQLRLAARMFERAAEGLVVTDARGRILTVNDAFTRITGWGREEVHGKTPGILRSGRQNDDFYIEMWRQLAELGWWQGEIWNRRKDGEVYLEWLSINAVRDTHGQVINYVGTFSDIQMVMESKQRVDFLATHDDLTGLPNRSLFQDRLKSALARRERSEDKLAVLFVDLDNFKVVNDTLGHDVGDALLREAAQRLLTCVREGDTAARLGGDEFTVLMERTDKFQAAAVATRILEAFTVSFALSGKELFVTASIGIGICPDDGQNMQSLLKNADAAMYQVKTSGKSDFQFFSRQMAEAAHRRMELEIGLRQALKANELFLVYQPQIDIVSGALVGAEALVRWRRKEGDVLLPAEFIPLAEETLLILPLGNLVLESACRQLAAWRRQRLPIKRVSVNLSANHFTKGDLLGDIQRLLKRYRLPGSALSIEVTESTLMSSNGNIPEMLGRLKELGIQVGIDDFGTGYSSLAYLKHYPIKELKIDHSFVDGIATDGEDSAIASAIIALAHTMGLSCVAEGVETEAQLAALQAKGCELAQGYLIGHPMPVPEFETWVAQRCAR